MFHHRTSRKKVETIVAVLEARAEGPQRPPHAVIVAKLHDGLATKKFALEREEARQIVLALDLWNLEREDAWDDEAEALFHECQKLFAKAYGEKAFSDPAT